MIGRSSAQDFYYHHTESSVSASLTAGGSTTDVPQGTPISVTLTATQSTWEVWMDENGNTENRYPSDGYAGQSPVTFAVVSGDSSISTTSTSTDSYGQASLTLTMGTQATALQASVTYNNSTATATLNCTPQSVETYVLDHTESSLTATLSSPGPTTNLPWSSTCTVNLHAQLETREVWISNYGNTDIRNVTSSPASNGMYYLGVQSAGSISPYYGTLDSSGDLTSTLSMSNQNAQVRADVSYGGYSAVATLDFTVSNDEIFQYDRTEHSLTMTMTPSSTEDVPFGEARPVLVSVQFNTWEVWVSNYGNSQTRNSSTTGAAGATVSLTTDSGAGSSISPSSSSADSGGLVNATFYMNYGDATTASGEASYSGYTATATLGFTSAEVFSFHHSEASLAANLTAPDGTVVPAGASKSAKLQALLTTWDVYTGSRGGTQNRNIATAGVNYASVYFSLENSPWGTAISPNMAYTDSSGISVASVTLSENNARVLAQVSAYVNGNTLSASAALDFTVELPPPPEVYTYSHTEYGPISVGASCADPFTNVHPGENRVLSVSASVPSWEVWTSNYGNSENRNQSGSAIDANFSYTIESGDGSITNSGGGGWGGYAYPTFTMGFQTTRLIISASSMYGGGQAPGSVTIDFIASTDEYFTFDHGDSGLVATLTAPAGATQVPNQAERPVTLHVSYDTWEVWLGNQGHSEIRNRVSTDSDGASVNFSVATGDGAVTPTETTTDSSGNAYATFTMGASASQLYAYVNYAPNSTSATLDFTPAPIEENFTLDRTESALGVTLNPSPDSTNVVFNAHRDIYVSAALTTWEVWLGDQGSTQLRNYNTSSAASASATYSIESGNGSVAATSGNLDNLGNATVGFTMGSQNTRVRVDVTFNGYTTSAAVDFSLPATETFNYDHTEYALRATLTSTDATSNVPPGSTFGARLEAVFDSWQIWVSDYGNTETRNATSSGASGASVSYTFETGDGYFSTSSSTTDAYGVAFNTITTGTQTTRLRADVSYSDRTVSATIQYSPSEVYALDHTENFLTATLTSGDGTTDVPSGAQRSMTLHAVQVTREVWISNYGHSEYRNESSTPAVYGSVSYSGGTLANTSASLDYSGDNYNTLYMGTESVTVQAAVSYNGYNTTASLTFSALYVPPPEEFTYHHTVSSNNVSISPSGSTSNLLPGDMVYLTLSAWTSSYEVWTSNYGNSDNRNYSSTPLDNTNALNWNHDGDGALSGGSQIYDGYATAYYTMGTQTTHITASVGGATTSLELTAAP